MNKVIIYQHPTFTISAIVGTYRIQCSNGLVIPEKKKSGKNKRK